MSEPLTMSTPRLYDVMEQRAVRSGDGLPSGAVLDEVESALAGVVEFLVGGVSDAVVAVAVKGEPNSITFDDIGRLITWADMIRLHAESLIETAARVAVVAHHASSVARGFESSDDMFDEHGRPVDTDWFKTRARECGFDLVA